jgi:hypothetical protein
MIGKKVEYTVANSSGATSAATGTVESVYSSNGSTYVNISGNQVPLTSVIAVADSSSSSSSSSSGSSDKSSS